MKIISKHKDYYDSVGYSHDASTGIYERKTTEIPVDWIGFGNSILSFREDWKLSTGLIGFCGKIYPYVEYKHRKPEGIKNIHEFLYSFEAFEKVRDSVKTIKASRHSWMGMNDLMPGWNADGNAKLWYDQQWTTIIEKRSYHWGGNGATPSYVVPSKVFIDYKTPYFALKRTGDYDNNSNGYKLILNPVLTDYKFYRMVDAYTAYQEVEMFLNNQIVRPDDPYIEPISDKIKAESHGFNKESFRKPKSEKR